VMRVPHPGNCTVSDGAGGRGARAAFRSGRPGAERATAPDAMVLTFTDTRA